MIITGDRITMSDKILNTATPAQSNLFYSAGGPSGVGVAVGNAVRTSLIVVVSVTLLVSLAIYGSNGNFNLSG